MKRIVLTFIITIFYLASFSQETGILTDQRDGKVYKTVKIGTQWIMAENLAYKPSGGNYWVYNNESTNIAKYGYLYDWNTALTLAPSGWHIPSDVEWTALTNYLGGTDFSGGKLKESGFKHWSNPNTCATNESGFTALPGAYRGWNGQFFGINGSMGVWWSSTENKGNSNNAWARSLDYENDKVNRESYPKTLIGLSIRCMRNDNITIIDSLTFTDPRDAKTYKIVKIGNQVWMAENLNYRPTRGNSWFYNNDSIAYSAKYGRLYDWKTAGGMSPPGWRLPSSDDWETLITFLGGDQLAGDKLKEAGIKHWKSPRVNSISKGATNEFEFTALPGGYRDVNGKFNDISYEGYWWSSWDENYIAYANYYCMRQYDAIVKTALFDKDSGLSIRCVRRE